MLTPDPADEDVLDRLVFASVKKATIFTNSESTACLMASRGLPPAECGPPVEGAVVPVVEAVPYVASMGTATFVPPVRS